MAKSFLNIHSYQLGERISESVDKDIKKQNLNENNKY